MNFILFGKNDSVNYESQHLMEKLQELKYNLEIILINIKKTINRPYTTDGTKLKIKEIQQIITEVNKIQTELHALGLDSREKNTLDHIIQTIRSLKTDSLTILESWLIIRSKDKSLSEQVELEIENSIDNANKSELELKETDKNSEQGDLQKSTLAEKTTQTTKKVMENSDFLKICSAHINKTYSGDPLGLQSFIDSINLLETLATTTGLKAFLVNFLKTRIEGTARELLNDNHNTTLSIINELRTHIKPDSSKVIEGRMLSLRISNTNSDDFSKRVEELSDSLRRSLVVEGISHAKATEMSIDKTIELCRKNTNSDLVKSVLESARFDSPKEVVAKLLTQTEKTKKEQQVYSFNAMRKDGNNNFRSNNNNFQNNSNRKVNRGRGNYNNNRGRGNYRNNRYNNNRNYRNNDRQGTSYENRNGRNNNYGNDRNVRSFGSENLTGPQQQLQLGENTSQRDNAR